MRRLRHAPTSRWRDTTISVMDIGILWLLVITGKYGDLGTPGYRRPTGSFRPYVSMEGGPGVPGSLGAVRGALGPYVAWDPGYPGFL